MQVFTALGLRLTQFWIARRGQDLIEYALLAGFVAVMAAAIVPSAASNIITIFTQVISALSVSPTGSQTTL
jgi:Flp pilus assembly pilin Flp